MNGILLGHNHIQSILRAQRKRERTGDTFGLDLVPIQLNHKSYLPTFSKRENKDDPRSLDSGLLKKLQKQFGEGPIDLVISCVMDAAFQRASLTNEIDITDGSFDDIARRRMGVDAALLLEAQFGLTDRPVFVVPPPPPISDVDYIEAHAGEMLDRVKEHGVVPFEQRVGLWKAFCAALESFCESWPNARFVELPEQVFDGNALARQYWAEDALVANDIFGAVLLDHISELAEEIGLVEKAV